jgi:replicative DNA helicase
MAKNLQDNAAERAVLAGLCQYGADVYFDLEFIEVDSFTDEINQIIFKCAKDILASSQKIELASILSAANKLNVYDALYNTSEMSYLRSLFNFPIHRENVQLHAAKLAKFRLAKDMKKTLQACIKNIDKIDGDEDISNIISIVEEPVLDITSQSYASSSNRVELIGEEIDDYIDHLKNNPRRMMGIPTGFKAYDEAIGGGLRRKCVDLVAARPKVGKSMFGDAVAANVAKQGIPVLVLDTEMGKEDHWNRMLASLSGVEIKKISTGQAFENDMESSLVEKAQKELKSLPYHYISIAGQPFENILGIMRKWIAQEVGYDENGRTNDCLVVYDYLKLMSSDGISSSMQEFQVLGFQITQLHNFMVKYDVPCLSFVQLNRDGITKESTDVVSGSDRLIWLCTSFTIFKMKSEEEVAADLIENGNRKLVPVVARHGEGLDDFDYINMIMDGKIGKITEGKLKSQLVIESRQKKEAIPSDENHEPTDIQLV